tara:strand:+ start:3595 stop:3840 length:246 start_codon:yes stop_codon:yes gene_type:complete
MIIKAWYKLDNEVVKAVRFEADSDCQPLEINIIYDNAPYSWDECVWDEGRVEPKPKKRVKRKVEVLETLAIEPETDNDTID